MKKIIVFLLCLTMGTSLLFAQDIERNIKERLTDYFAKYTATAKISTLCFLVKISYLCGRNGNSHNDDKKK